MLNKPKNVEIKYEYNCFENNTQLLDEIKELYEYAKEKKYICPDSMFDEDFEFISKCLKFMDKKIIYEWLRKDYQGTAYILFRPNTTLVDDEVILYKTEYGSCSYCDVWQRNSFIENLYDEARDSVKFPNIFEAIKYLLCEHFFEDDIKRFAIEWANKTIEWANKYHKNNEEVKKQIEQIKICLKECEE